MLVLFVVTGGVESLQLSAKNHKYNSQLVIPIASVNNKLKDKQHNTRAFIAE